MKVPEVQQCCCGCSLETGTQIIGYMHVFSSLFMIMGHLQRVLEPDYTTEYFEVKENVALLHTLCLLSLLLSICGFIISTLLIIGVNKRIEIFFNIWLFFVSFNMFSTIILMFGFIIFCLFLSMAGLAAIFLVVYLLLTALGLYMVVVVNSCKLSMMNREMASNET